MLDFTLLTYKHLLASLKKAGYTFLPYESFSQQNHKKYIILRHDVDKLPFNSLLFAQIENELDIRGTYYFRIVKGSNQPDIIIKIRDLGHEIGYHYEDLALAHGEVELAINSFCNNLDYFRQYYPVKTICMHGSPLSRYDNRKIWDKYNYKDYGIVGEPYFDINFSDVLYLTDTGRQWNGENVSIRDKICDGRKIFRKFQSTFDIINAVEQGMFPEKVMITIHPQRWSNDAIMWMKELIYQSLKNSIKTLILRIGKS